MSAAGGCNAYRRYPVALAVDTLTPASCGGPAPEVPGSSTVNGTQLDQDGCNQTNEQWYLLDPLLMTCGPGSTKLKDLGE